MSYKKERLCWLLLNGTKKHVYAVVAKNGKAIAECKTEAMADKVIKGLILVAEDEQRKANFKL